MKIIKVALLALITHIPFLMSNEAALEMFANKYPGSIYQDIVIGADIHSVGSDQCEPRYELLKPILQAHGKPFTLLDLGAAQGYFSFRAATDFPESSFVMIEDNNTAYYAHHGNMLYDLCQLNKHLKNVFYLQRRVDLGDLKSLNEKTHFDFIFAFLVVHLMHETLKEQIKIVDALLQLSDNLIIEVANDVGVIHTSYVEYLSNKLDCQYIGEVKRHKDPESTSTGKIYWFKKKSQNGVKDVSQPIPRDLFYKLGGIHPLL